MGTLLPQDILNLSNEERLKRLIDPAGYAPETSINRDGPVVGPYNPYDPRDTALAASTASSQQEFGMPRMSETGDVAPNQTSGELLSSQADMHNEKAMSMLQKALESQSEISPSQALAAGVLALVPTLGGYIAGKSVGSPELSPHLRLSLDQLQKGMTGGAQGGLTGLGAGAQASQQYLTGIDKEFQQRQKILGEQAGLEAKLGNQYKNADLQNQMGALSSERDIQKELELSKQGLGRYGGAEKELIFVAALSENPLAASAMTKRSQGQIPTPEEDAALNAIPGGVARGAQALAKASYNKMTQANITGDKQILPTEKTKTSVSDAISASGLLSRYSKKWEELASKQPGWLERTTLSQLPPAELGQLKKDMSMAAVLIRNLREPGVMTEPDFLRYDKYLTIQPLDTIQSYTHRFKEMIDTVKLAASSRLSTARASGERVDDLEALLNSNIPTSGTVSAPATGTNTQARNDSAPRETATQMLARIRATPKPAAGGK